MTSSPRSPPRTVCYLAETDATAREGAAALERVPSGPERSVQPLTTDAVDGLAGWAAEVDCVVFAETPTTAAGATLLEVVEACGETPLVLFSESSYAPTAARSTDGIDGYVRRDTDDAVAHLADEIEWVCHGANEADADETEGDANAAAAGTGEASPDPTPIAMPGDHPATTDPSAERFLESVPDLAASPDRDHLFELLVETASDALERDYCWLSTVHFGDLTPRATAPDVSADALETHPRDGVLDECLRSGDPVRIDDLATDDRLDPPLEGVSSVCCAPVSDVGVLLVAAEEPAAFDERDAERLAAWGRFGAAVLERLETETRLRNDRNRLRQARDRLESERDDLEADRAELEAELDRDRTLFANVPEPTIRYEIEDGRPIVRDVNDAFTAVFDTDPESVVDRPVDEETVPPGLEHRRAALTDALCAGERRQLVSRRETVDGVREFCLTLVPLEAADGTAPDAESAGAGTDADAGTDDGADNPEGLVVYSDVTEANRRERELAAAEDRLETIAELIAEDVRTPLNVARGYLELAEATGDAEHFAEIEAAQERLLERVEQLDAIARRDEVVAETEPVAIHDVARRAWVAVETGDARLVTGENLVLEADKARLRELFEHLLRAAVESVADEDGANGPGPTNGSPVVTVSAADDGFLVTGHRPGADVSRAGAETTPVAGRLTAADGTGFGLGPVERIADAHGWTVGVAEEEGTTVAVRGVERTDVDGS
ncbi:GAF domain-containing protein [Haloterrigena alkaliphila]|uniref:histidine kinase n=1 Tax=Haloterrigena alkaliphila TaxID=2816475 RepID=A0A8A2VGK1_9EURY|nr:GAF domain-containing sensor histidine kinase [Haloterrigena alkaliphila]QSX00642.1 GAF domain-containing sensor histidine kinase [Haloterrigena alkaliphila]